MITKTYRLKFSNSYATTFKVGEKEVGVQFIGTPNQKGEYTTSSEELQKVMEESNSFNTVYSLTHTYDDEKRVIVDKVKGEVHEVAPTTSVELKEVTAKNLQGINDLVKELFPSYGKTFKSSEKAVAYFADNGYKLVIE